MSNLLKVLEIAYTLQLISLDSLSINVKIHPSANRSESSQSTTDQYINKSILTISSGVDFLLGLVCNFLFLRDLLGQYLTGR